MTRPDRTGEPIPTRRRIVLAYVLLAVLGVGGLVVLGEALRHDTPFAGPVTPELTDDVDPLRQEVECPVPEAREGGTRQSAAMGPAVVEEVTSNGLYDCPGWWDGRMVRYTGEVVGAVLDRGDHAWVQLNDDVYADASGPLPTHRDFRGGNAGVGARITAEHAAAIRTVGGPHTHGDLIEVEATFRRVDEATGEVAILDVQAFTVLREGGRVTPPPVPIRRGVALAAAAVTLAILALERRRRRER